MGSVPCSSACSACLIRSASATSKPSASPSPASIRGAIAGSTGSSGFSGHFGMTSGYLQLTRSEQERRIASVDLEEVLDGLEVERQLRRDVLVRADVPVQ